MINRTYECDTWEACYRFGVVGLPYGPLAGGVLSGKYHDGTQWGDGGSGKTDKDRPASESRMRAQKDFQPRCTHTGGSNPGLATRSAPLLLACHVHALTRPALEPRAWEDSMPMAMLATDKYIALAEEYGVTPTELALAWANQRPCNTSVIIGTTTVAQVDACVAAFKLELPEELMDKIDAVHEEFRNPSMFYCDKPTCMEAKWLGSAACPASKPRSSIGKMHVAAACMAAAAALGVAFARR